MIGKLVKYSNKGEQRMEQNKKVTIRVLNTFS